jgi:hypothetical protein
MPPEIGQAGMILKRPSVSRARVGSPFAGVLHTYRSLLEVLLSQYKASKMLQGNESAQPERTMGALRKSITNRNADPLGNQ